MNVQTRELLDGGIPVRFYIAGERDVFLSIPRATQNIHKIQRDELLNSPFTPVRPLDDLVISESADRQAISFL